MKTIKSESDFRNRLIGFAKLFINRLPEFDIENSIELILRREWGAGFEKLCVQLVEYKVELNAKEKEEIKEIADAMQISLTSLG